MHSRGSIGHPQRNYDRSTSVAKCVPTFYWFATRWIFSISTPRTPWTASSNISEFTPLTTIIARRNSAPKSALPLLHGGKREGHIGRVTSSTATACWREFLAMTRELSPPFYDAPTPLPLADGQMSTIDWDPRLCEDHG